MEAKAFYDALIKRLSKFNLEIAEDKTKIIKLNRKSGDDGESFDFLGFTFYMSKIKYMRCKTSKKKFRASLLKCKLWIKENLTMPTKEFMFMVQKKMIGHINYFAVTHNYRMISNFIFEVRKQIFRGLNRRSQRRSYNWSGYAKFLLKYPLPIAHTNIKIYELGAGASYVL